MVQSQKTQKKSETCSKLVLKTPERRNWCRYSVFIAFTPFSTVSIVDFEQVNVS